MLKGAADVGRAVLLLPGAPGTGLFCLARFARASKMDDPVGAAGPAGAATLPCKAAKAEAGGLPGGVVEISAGLRRVRYETSELTAVLCLGSNHA